jgi:hypothetical protein
MKRFEIIALTNSDLVIIHKLTGIPKGEPCPMSREMVKALVNLQYHCDSADEANAKANEFRQDKGAIVVAIRDQLKNEMYVFYDDEKIRFDGSPN